MLKKKIAKLLELPNVDLIKIIIELEDQVRVLTNTLEQEDSILGFVCTN